MIPHLPPLVTSLPSVSLRAAKRPALIQPGSPGLQAPPAGPGPEPTRQTLFVRFESKKSLLFVTISKHIASDWRHFSEA